MLRMDKSISEKEKHQRVEEVITQVTQAIDK